MLLHCVDLGLIDYVDALHLQEDVLLKRYHDECEDTLFLLEHPPVFTLGRGGDETHILTPHEVPIHRVGRGGDVTFHGPGQLVGYPIIQLASHGRDVHAYLRGIETVLIEVLSQYQIVARREPGLTGVWVDTRKIASIGVGVRRWVTYHGFALNVATDLRYFNDIVPCGIRGVQMVSMSSELGYPVLVDSMKPVIAKTFARYFGYEEIVWKNL
jgi:lipoate-protein ligase B